MSRDMSGKTDKTAIIGAGASGLAAAVAQARLGRDVTVFEHKDKAGLKLSLTGNGRCNFTNAYMHTSCFHESDASALGRFLYRFTTEDAVNFIASLGLDTESRSGYFYPATYKAQDVVDALLIECERKGVSFYYNVSEIDINELRGSYDRVILACGSRAHKETGSNGTGYKLLEKLGIPYTRVLPALCALYCDDIDFLKENKGKRTLATVTVDGHKATGEVQITEYGISGIPVFNISRYVSRMLDKNERSAVIVNFDPDENDIPEIIKNREHVNSYKPITGDKIKTLNITKTAAFDKSQVCTGGVSLDDLADDFEVRKIPGIYVIGEMCDVDGICGGYNLHWAWLSGNLSAR